MTEDGEITGTPDIQDVEPDPWAALARFTPARIGLGRAGSALPTREVLAFGLAHAQARDAVHTPFATASLAADFAAAGFETIPVESRATSRALYLRRPDLGRRLSEASRDQLASQPGPFDLAIVVADGLSSTAVHLNAAPFAAALRPHLDAAGYRLAPVVVASGARVALGDEVGALLGARAVIVLVGERPGLSSPDSLGAYLTFAPRIGRTDAERNCISNIRAAGLSHAAAAAKLAWLLREALRLQLTGVALKDESDAALQLGGEAALPAIAPG